MSPTNMGAESSAVVVPISTDVTHEVERTKMEATDMLVELGRARVALSAPETGVRRQLQMTDHMPLEIGR
jgi:hypothetical protein